MRFSDSALFIPAIRLPETRRERVSFETLAQALQKQINDFRKILAGEKNIVLVGRQAVVEAADARNLQKLKFTRIIDRASFARRCVGVVAISHPPEEEFARLIRFRKRF